MKYPTADPDFLAMCKDLNFDRDRAEVLLSSKIDVNLPVTQDLGSLTSLPFTYLYEAAQYNNISMVELLLRHGADPNLCDDKIDNVLWDLQYNDANEPGADIANEYVNGTVRLRIVQMLLFHGADPNIRIDGESLYEYVRYKVFNEMGEPDWEYLMAYFKLLIMFGGGNMAGWNTLDRDHPEKYKICFQDAGDGYHLYGVLYEGKELEIEI